MTDRQPASGQAGRVLITPESSGQMPFYAKIEMADNPIDPGTPINKATLLQDMTASQYGLGSDAVPDDVFAKIEPQLPQIGDIKMTARTSLGDKWLLCNGGEISQSEYPELYALLSEGGITKPWKENKVWSAFDSPPQGTTSIVYGSGYYVMTCGNSKNNTVRIYYSQSAAGPWTLALEINDGGINTYINRVRYINDTFIAVGEYSDDPYIWYASDPTGDWTGIKISETASAVLDIVYANGQYIAATNYSIANRSILYYSSTLNGAWTGYTMSLGQYNNLLGIAYGGGYFVVPVRDSNSQMDKIVYSENVTGPWTTATPFAQGEDPYDIVYADGYFVVITTNYIWYIQGAPSGTWQSKPSEEMHSRPEKLNYIDGTLYYCELDGGVIHYSESVTGDFATVAVGDISNCGGIASDGSSFASIGYSNDDYVTVPYVLLGGLPNITVDDRVYAYIKALDN